MFKFFMFILLIGLFGFLLIGVLLGRVIRFFGGAPEKTKSGQRKSKNKSHNNEASSNVPKKFSKNEGEYVDYEEIKEE